MEKQTKRMLEEHQELVHSENRKVLSHVQREDEDWILHTLMLENVEVPFKFRRKKKYKNLKGTRVNLTYYPSTKNIAGLDFEYMKVVRLRQS